MAVDLSKTLTPLEPLIEPIIRIVPQDQRRLGGFIFLAALAHLAAFTFIEIRYPTPFLPVVSGLRVMLDNPDPLNPAARSSLGAWSNLFDPSSLIVPGEPLIQRGDFKITPPPLFQKATVDPAPAAGLAREPQFLPDHAAPLVDRVKAGFNPPLKMPVYARSIPLPGQRETMLELSPSLQPRFPQPGPVLPKAAAGSITEAGVTQLRIGIDQDGRVEYALVEQSCGKSATDALGLEAVRRIKFEAAGQPGITWGEASLFWQFQGEATAAPEEPPRDKL